MGHVCALLEGLRNMMEEIRRTVCIKDKQHKLHVAHLRHGVRKKPAGTTMEPCELPQGERMEKNMLLTLGLADARALVRALLNITPGLSSRFCYRTQLSDRFEQP